MTEQVRFNSLLDRLEQVVSKLEKAGSAAPAAGAAAGGASAAAAVAVAAQVTAFDEYYETYVQPFLDTTRKIGGDLNQMADIFEKGYKALREVISIASQAKQPADAEVMPVFQPIVKTMEEAEKYRQSKRPADSFNHLSTVSEGIKALGWPGVPKTPGPFVKEMLDAAQFYGTKVLVKYKATDKTHVDWVNQHKELLEQLQAYIKEYHTTGLKWNANGKSVKEVQAGASAAPAAKAPAPQAGAGAVPPPPPPGPPPPPPTFDAAAAPAAAAGGAAGMADVFAAINQGEGITSRLRKVKDEEKTKNRKDRVAVVTIDDSKTAAKESKATGSAKEEPAKIELVDNKKWVVQGQKNNKEIVIDQVDLKMSVYIYKCTGSLIQIKGKVNAIIVDTCTKTDVVFDDALSSIEFVNCKSVKFQVNGKVPTVNIDKTDGIAVYLSKASIDATIITAKSSEMNVNVPEGDDDFVEHPVPEQFVTRYDHKTKKFVTTLSESI